MPFWRGWIRSISPFDVFGTNGLFHLRISSIAVFHAEGVCLFCLLNGYNGIGSLFIFPLHFYVPLEGCRGR